MAAQRRIDLVLDSVKRLLRIGASANLLNLLQKQHPADLAQVFSELPDKERVAAFSLLAERNGRLAMEAIWNWVLRLAPGCWPPGPPRKSPSSPRKSPPTMQLR